MLEHVELFFKSIFIDNMVFAVFLGMCSYLAVSKKVSTAVGLGAAVIFVLAVTVPLNWLLDQYLLQPGALTWLGPEYADYDLSFPSFILFIATIATMVQLVEIVVEKFSPSLYNSLGIFLPLIAVNCAILGGSLFMQAREIATLGLAFNYGVSSGIGWFLAILAIAAIREKIRYSNVPPPLRGLGITRLAPADGAFYVYIDVAPTGLTSAEFCDRALAEAHVSLTPGKDFGHHTADDHVRLSYAASTDDLTEGIRRLGEFVNSLRRA